MMTRRGAYEWKVIVGILELSVVGVDLIDEKRYLLALLVSFDRPA